MCNESNEMCIKHSVQENRRALIILGVRYPRCDPKEIKPNALSQSSVRMQTTE